MATRTKAKCFQIGVRNSLTEDSTLELYFLDVVDDYIDWNEFTWVNLVQDVINKVNAAKPKKIICFIASEGGSCEIGLAIYAFLKYYNAEVETRTLSMAGSIASVLQQAASPGMRYIAKSGRMVIHKAWAYGAGNADDLRQVADVLDLYTDQICEIYAEVSGKGKDHFQELIAGGDYWMTGEQAVNEGLADGMFDDIPAGFSLQNNLRDLDEHYVNVPEDLKALITGRKPDNNIPKPSIMKTIKERANDFLNKLKGSNIDPKATNLAEEVANVVSGPLEEMLEGVHADLDEKIAGQEATITNAVKASFATELQTITQNNTDLQTKVGELEVANAKLIKDLTDLSAGEGKPKDDPKNEVKAIGRGKLAAAGAEQE